MTTADRDSCCADAHAGPSLRLEDALERILRLVRPVDGAETLAVRSALGRILLADVVSRIDVPAHTNSAMDGYALARTDLPVDEPRALSVVGVSAAGRPFDGELRAGQCVRIMTGAPLPTGADTVVMQENVRQDGAQAIFAPGERPGQHVRQAGEDIRAGDVALQAGKRLGPAELGMLASVGVSEVTVRRRPRVAFFSTGDELKSVGEALGPGQIYDSNRYVLHGLLRRLAVDPMDLGVLRDRPADVEQAFDSAAKYADAIVSSGGVSVGEADYVKQTLERIGAVEFWKVAMKPGRPIAFGRVGEALFFGLPGNPVSVMATFYQLVQPALLALAGNRDARMTLTLTAIATEPLRKKRGRREFQRGVLSRDANGRYVVRGTGQQGSGILRSMSEANCFIVLDEDAGPICEGGEVIVQPFAAFV